MTTSNYTSKIRVKYLQKIIQFEVIIKNRMRNFLQHFMSIYQRSLVQYLDQFLPLKVLKVQGHSLLKIGNCLFSKVKTLIFHKLANFGQNSKSKTILKSGKDSASDGQKKFQKTWSNIFFSKKLIFHVWSSGAKAPPKRCFFLFMGWWAILKQTF